MAKQEKKKSYFCGINLKMKTYFNGRLPTALSSSIDKVDSASPVGDIIILGDEFEQSHRI